MDGDASGALKPHIKLELVSVTKYRGKLANAIGKWVAQSSVYFLFGQSSFGKVRLIDKPE